ncbi:hypothetical protein EI94DRAFT_1773013 [Lactarius quietus]|nr:hypothetical protein EI94DRAFT_1773013 [Lactarius quietus]
MDVSEAEVHDKIACVLSVEDPDDSSEAWEYLDPALNRLLRYGSTVEDVAQCMQHGPLGVEGLGHLIHRFVVKHGITGGLLEGKIGILLSAIEMLKNQHEISVLPGQMAVGAYPFLLHVEEHVPWEFSSRHSSLLFRKVLAHMQEGARENTPYKYHGLTSLAELALRKERTIKMYHSRRLNDTHKLLQREGVIALHHQILLAMSTGNVPWVDRVLQVASDRGSQGIYHPKGFREEEDLQTLLFLRLGGQHVTEMAHRMFGIPAPSTIRHHTMLSPLICSTLYPLEEELEKRPQWCDRTNKILGCCHEHTKRRCMEFNSVADGELLLQDVAQGDATVGAIGLHCTNLRLYCARPFLISGSCKKESAKDHAVLIQMALNAINQVEALRNAHIVSIASDGEAKRGKSLIQLTFKHTLSASSPIYPWLSACTLLDLHKHVGAKRPRNALLHEKGVLVYGTWIMPAVLRSHLLKAGHKLDHIHTVLNPNDKQDMMLTFSLLHDIWTLPNLSSGSPVHIQAHRALSIFGSLCCHILVPYLYVDLSLEDQLKCLSYAAHLALVLDAHDNTCSDFLPTALYVNLILMIQNVFFCVAKAKVDTPEEDFSIVLLGTDRLESLFGCLHTIVGNDTNVDNYQLGAWLTGTMEATNILALHPEWDKVPQCLHLPLLSQDMTTIPDSTDHISPRSWRELQSLHTLDAEYPFASDVLHAVESTLNASLLAPFGTLLVHVSEPFPTDDVKDVSHDDILHNLAPGVVVQDHTTHDTDTPIISDGMCRLEDAVTAQEWAPDNHTFTNAVELADNGGPINKCHALSLMFKYSKSTSSTDRLRRVQQQARFLQSESDVLLDDSPNEGSDILLIHNAMAFLLACDNSLFLCLREIIAIHMGPKSIDHLPLDVLHEDSIQVTIQAYSLVGTSPEECVRKNDWHTCGHLPMKFKVPGPLIQPLNPCLATPPSHLPYYLFDMGTLISLASTLHDHLTNPYLKLVPNMESSHQFSYRKKSVGMNALRVYRQFGWMLQMASVCSLTSGATFYMILPLTYPRSHVGSAFTPQHCV